MLERAKWTIANRVHSPGGNGSICHDKKREILLDILDSNSLAVFFQPIFSSKNSKIYGYEALASITTDHPFESMHTLFINVIQNGI